MQVRSQKDFRIVIDDFDRTNRNYYTNRLRSAKGLIFVVKGIKSSIPIDEVRAVAASAA